MPVISIDGQEYEVEQGDNLLQACLSLGLVHQVVENDCAAAALAWAERVAEMQSASIAGAGRLLNTNIEALRLRLQAELETFVIQIQTQQALDGINDLLRRQEHA